MGQCPAGVFAPELCNLVKQKLCAAPRQETSSDRPSVFQTTLMHVRAWRNQANFLVAVAGTHLSRGDSRRGFDPCFGRAVLVGVDVDAQLSFFVHFGHCDWEAT